MSGEGEGSAPSRGGRIGPWTRNASRSVYKNDWIHVREDAVTRPDGKPGIYAIVEFANLAVGVVALNPAGEIILVGQHRYPLDYYAWEIPEGGCLRGADTPESAAARELREETGLEAARWDYLGCLAVSNAVNDEIAHFFLARDLTQNEAQPEPTEVLETRWMPLEEACVEVLEGRLTDSITAAALLRARHFLDREKQGSPIAGYPRRP